MDFDDCFDVTKRRNVDDWGTISGLIMSTSMDSDEENKQCDAFYSDKAALKLLKERNFDLVFSDYLYSSIRYIHSSPKETQV